MSLLKRGSFPHNRLLTTMSLAKTAGPIDVPFGVWTRVGQRNIVLDGGQDPPDGKGQLRAASTGQL